MKYRLWLEQILLFVVIPILIWRYREGLKGVQAGGSFIVLLLPFISSFLMLFMVKTMHFSMKELWFLPNFKQNFLSILKFFIPSAIVYTVATYIFMPEHLFQLPKENPKMWLLIMFAYPLFSVLPQGVIYRVFYFKRYAHLFQNPKMLIFINGLFFCFAHILFNNFVALAFTFVGGLLFAWRYNKTQSWLISSLEHAMYGNLLFTIGIGRFLVSGMN